MIAIKTKLCRKTTENFWHYNCPIVVTLLPGDLIQLKEHGRRESSAVAIHLHDLYVLLCERRAFRERMEKAKAAKARKGAKARRR